jgi:hypothetical protein
MLTVILANSTMLITFQVVLILLGLGAIANIVKSWNTSVDVSNLASFITRPVLTEVFPLILLSLLTAVDPTHFVVLIFYYLAALLIAIRILLELGKVLKNK